MWTFILNMSDKVKKKIIRRNVKEQESYGISFNVASAQKKYNLL